MAIPGSAQHTADNSFGLLRVGTRRFMGLKLVAHQVRQHDLGSWYCVHCSRTWPSKPAPAACMRNVTLRELRERFRRKSA